MVQSLPLLLAVVLGASTARAAAPLDPAAPDAAAPDAAAPAAPTSGPASAEATSEMPAASPAEGQPSESEPPAAPPHAAAPSPTPAPVSNATPPAASKPARPPRTYPRLVIAGGPLVGPHAIGNEECDPEQGRCETKGSFIGVGAQVELRARLWRLVQAHARGLAVGNASPNDRVHRGLWGLGAGVGLQGRRAFGRAEYLFVSTFGDNRFEPPFFEGEVATDEWGHHAGMLSVGFRQPLPRGVSAELWGGLVIGPRSVRRVPDTLPDERVLTTFLVGLNVSWDAVP